MSSRSPSQGDRIHKRGQVTQAFESVSPCCFKRKHLSDLSPFSPSRASSVSRLALGSSTRHEGPVRTAITSCKISVPAKPQLFLEKSISKPSREYVRQHGFHYGIRKPRIKNEPFFSPIPHLLATAARFSRQRTCESLKCQPAAIGREIDE
jgi:hypothetical protein